ncbi:uncharacterized protein LOC21401793 isoform X1 [Morus notabilis]|uniref:uncharacterized protein LOC21401793 isoform X1 n=1 Tax=Morus notabilis TaxID=981085 RepID=UPI000CED153D|nr:uncharacterized protein LOC21401793 isoform X1 [Morus notabilis]
MEEMVFACAEFEGENVSCPRHDACMKRSGISAFIFSENQSLVLASLFLLLIVEESRDLNCLLIPIIGLNGLHEVDGNFVSRFIHQILNALLKVLASKAPISVLIKWHTGWFLQKLLIVGGNMLDDHNLELFSIAYEQSRQQLEKELDGCWFDSIPDTLRNEWMSCKTALEEPCQHKDPFFILELAVAQQTTYGTTIVFWLLAFSQWIKVHLPNILAFTTCFYWKVNEYYL